MKTLSNKGFTLIELLLAMAVLAIVLLFLSEAVGAVSRTWINGSARIDTFSKARVILGLLDRDLQSAVFRPDLAAFVDESGSNSFAFYTQIGGSQGNRCLSLVRYTLSSSASNSLLQRADYGLDYTNGTLSLANTNALPDASKTSPLDLADGILRFEWQYVASDGTFQSGYRYDPANPSSPANTRSMVVSIIALDDRALGLAAQTGTLANLLGKFSGPPPAGQTYATFWNAGVRSPSFADGLPKPVSGGVRIFERRYALH